MIAYTYYAEHPRLRTYLTVFAFLALGLMAKPMLVTLPLVLILLDYWPLQRFERKCKESYREYHAEISRQGEESMEQAAKRGQQDTPLPVQGQRESSGKHGAKTSGIEEKPTTPKCQCASTSALLLEKMPFIALTATSSIITFLAQLRGGLIADRIPVGVRFANAFVSYVIYIEKAIFPYNLAFFYPYQVWASWQILGALLFLIAVTLIVWTCRRFQYLTVGLLWFAGTLVPVIGIVQVGEQAMADRYTYIPLIGLFIMIGWGVPELLKSWRYCKQALVASSILILSSLSLITWIQVGYWRDSFALYDHALETTCRNYFIHYCRGSAYYSIGKYSQAILDYDRAIQISPECPPVYYGRGLAYAGLGNYKQAVNDYNTSITMNPRFLDAYNQRGIAYLKLNSPKRALMDFDKAVEMNPELGMVYVNRGNAYMKLGNHMRAFEDYDKAIELHAELFGAYYNRGNAYRDLGKHRQAISDYDEAIKINPEHAAAYNNRGIAYAEIGDRWRAISDYDRAIQTNPDYADAYYNRGVARVQLGYDSLATEDMKTAAKLGSEEAKKLLRSQGIGW